MKAAARAELPVDRLHQLAAEQVVAAVPLVEKRRVVEERLHQEEVLAEEVAEVLHGLEDAAEEAEAGPHLPGREPRGGRAPLLAKVSRQRAEERLLTVVVAIDAEAL